MSTRDLCAPSSIGAATGPRRERTGIRILIVDDHPLIREGLANVLRELDEVLEVLEAESAEQALETLRTNQALTLVLLDLILPGTDGLSLLHQIRAQRPDVPVVVLSARDSPETVHDAINIGAMGFISKRSSTPVLVSALRLVLAGAIYIPQEALAHTDPRVRLGSAGPVHAPSHQPGGLTPADVGLTERQAQVLALIIQGKPNKTICRELGLAEGTVKTHIAAILRALKVSSRTQAVYSLSKLGVRLPFMLESAAGAEHPLP
jgi:DNA-binding NarL/FixJ family response regulator